MDRIELRGMSFHGRHGVGDAERASAQEFRVDVEAEADLEVAGRSDRIDDTVDYRRVHAAAKEVIEGPSKHLLETLAADIARRVLEVSGVQTVSVRVTKRPARMLPLDAASVHIKRTRA